MARALFFSAILYGCAVLPLGAQPLPQPDAVVETLVVDSPSGAVVEGSLDWTHGALTVTGQGVAPADITSPVQRRLLGFRAAKLVAYRNLLEVVGGVQVDARTTVSMTMVASDSVRARVEGLVRGARVVPGSQREEDGAYSLQLRLDLRGDLSTAVLPDTGATKAVLPPELPAADSLIVFLPPAPYTGLVVDARGTGLRPSLSPRIVDDTGRVIYTAEHVDRQRAVQVGVVAYERDLERAVGSDRVGGASGNPFVVDAVGVAGLYNADVVVTRDAGTRILMADMDDDFLGRCGVVFVVGPRPPPPPAPTLSDAATGDSTTSGVVPQRDFLDSILEARAAADSAAAVQE